MIGRQMIDLVAKLKSIEQSSAIRIIMIPKIRNNRTEAGVIWSEEYKISLESLIEMIGSAFLPRVAKNDIPLIISERVHNINRPACYDE